MSFATEVKAEVGQNILKPCCTKAQLAALVQLCSTINFNNKGMNLNIRTENATTAKRIWKLMKDSYNPAMELSVFRKMKLKKNNIYVIQVKEKVSEILKDLTLFNESGLQEHPQYRLVRKECCARAYLAGAFMASGSVNSPQKTSYHLEISTLRETHAKYIQDLMHRFDLPAKCIVRRNQFVVYLKISEKISDFMRCIGAHNSVMAFEDMRIQRDFKNSLTRIYNCEVANEMKTMEAARKQSESIEILKQYHRFEHLDSKLYEAANLRLEFPEASLNELCQIYEERTGTPISKSGMKHRLARLIELAEKITKQNETSS